MQPFSLPPHACAESSKCCIFSWDLSPQILSTARLSLPLRSLVSIPESGCLKLSSWPFFSSLAHHSLSCISLSRTCSFCPRPLWSIFRLIVLRNESDHVFFFFFFAQNPAMASHFTEWNWHPWPDDLGLCDYFDLQLFLLLFTQTCQTRSYLEPLLRLCPPTPPQNFPPETEASSLGRKEPSLHLTTLSLCFRRTNYSTALLAHMRPNEM